MKKVEAIVKVTEACNLRCAYCYNSESCYPNDVLPLQSFEKFLNILCTAYDTIVIMWHGGEPLCAGIEYFKQAVEAEKRVSVRRGVEIHNSVQTNGTLINSAWVKFFKENDFKVGISFDGLQNDKYRQETKKTLKAIKMLKSANLKFGCLAVVADDEYDLEANYNYFCENNLSVDFSVMFGEGGGKNLKGVNIKNYAKACCELFDKWIYDANGVSVRTFVSYIRMALGGKFRVCTFCSCHTKYLSVYPDGNIYNCGRAGVTAYPFGNVNSVNTVKELFASQGATSLIKGSVLRREKCKQSCELFSVCAGGCADIAIAENGLENIPEQHCYLFKTLYTHIAKSVAGIMEKEVPLDTLNPALKSVLADNLIRINGGISKKLPQTYLP